MSNPSASNDTAEIRRAKKMMRVVIRKFFRVMDQHHLAPVEALMAVTGFVLTFMLALEAGGDAAQTQEECAQRAAEWFLHVRACIARGEAPEVGITGLPH